ncbi:hypothetical protein FRC07_009727 [Ceratobasidium sp. 392]|nr:hypothetical protein FRC07_009727 [Ceratobasidium sp. 392]
MAQALNTTMTPPLSFGFLHKTNVNRIEKPFNMAYLELLIQRSNMLPGNLWTTCKLQVVQIGGRELASTAAGGSGFSDNIASADDEHTDINEDDTFCPTGSMKNYGLDSIATTPAAASSTTASAATSALMTAPAPTTPPAPATPLASTASLVPTTPLNLRTALGTPPTNRTITIC